MDVRYTDNTFAYLNDIVDTTLSDSGTLRPCLNDLTTVNLYHTVYVGNVSTGKKIKHFWDDEAKRATIGATDYNSITYKFDVYVR